MVTGSIIVNNAEADHTAMIIAQRGDFVLVEAGWMPWPNDEWHLLESPPPVSPDPDLAGEGGPV